MGSYIGTWKDYYNLQEEEFFKQNKVTNYEELLAGLYSDETKEITSAYETGLKNAQDLYKYNTQEATSNFQYQTNSLMKQTRYDISNAYANYKKSQLNLMQQNMLGSGFKDYYGSQLKSAFNQAVSDYKFNESEKLNYLSKQYEESLLGEEQNLLKNTTSLNKSYESALESLAKDQEKTKKEIEKQLEEGSKKYAQIEGIIREIIGIDDSNSDKYYDTIIDTEKGTKTIKLKDLGIDEFDRVLNSRFTDTDAFVMKDPNDKTKEKKYYSLTDYLFDLDQDLYEFYVDNKSNINKWVAGLESDDNSYTKEERRYEMERKDFETQINELIKNTTDSGAKANMQKKLDDLAKKEFKTNAEKRNAYETLKNEFETRPLEQHKVSSEDAKELSVANPTTGGKYFNIDGKSYEEVSMFKNKNSTTTSSDTPLDVYNAVGLGTRYQNNNMKKNNLSEGSIVTHNGKYYVIRKNPNKYDLGDLTYFLMELKPVQK